MTTFASGETRGFHWGQGPVSDPPSVKYEDGHFGAPLATRWKVTPAGADDIVKLKYKGGEAVGSLIKVTVYVAGTPHIVHAQIVS
jgi:hypothetical protein